MFRLQIDKNRIEVLERANEHHSATHREIIKRVRITDVQENKLDAFPGKVTFFG